MGLIIVVGVTACGNGGTTSEGTTTGGTGGGAGGASTVVVGPGPVTNSQSSASSGGGEGTTTPGPCWSPLAGVPAYCELYTLDEPSDEPPLSWIPCAGATTGCRELEITWAPADPNRPFFVSFAGQATEAGPFVVFRRKLGGELTGWSDMVMAYADGPVRAVVRGRDPSETDAPCAPVFPAVGAGRVVAGISDRTQHPPPAEYELQLPLEAGTPSIFTTLSAETIHTNSGFHRSPGESFVALAYTPGSKILTVPYDGSAPTVVDAYTVEVPVGLDEPQTVGTDVVYWAVYDDRARAKIHHAATGITETLLDVPGYDVYSVRTDGETLVWIQSSPPRSESETPDLFELWTSPHATTPAGLVPQKLADLARGVATPYTVLQSGLIALRGTVGPDDDISWSRNLIIHPGDMTYWTLDAPDGLRWGDTMYVAPDEIALPVQPPWKAGETLTIRRQELSALGEPQPILGVLGAP